MSEKFQTAAALLTVAAAAVLLLRHALKRRGRPGCGGDTCGAVSPEIKNLRAKLPPRTG